MRRSASASDLPRGVSLSRLLGVVVPQNCGALVTRIWLHFVKRLPVPAVKQHATVPAHIGSRGARSVHVGSQPVFRHLFQEYGLPRIIRTDNGVPFATTALGRLSRLSVWWIRLGIYPERLFPPAQARRLSRAQTRHPGSAVSHRRSYTVTYVPGLICYLCPRPFIPSFAMSLSNLSFNHLNHVFPVTDQTAYSCIWYEVRDSIVTYDKQAIDSYQGPFVSWHRKRSGYP